MHALALELSSVCVLETLRVQAVGVDTEERILRGANDSQSLVCFLTDPSLWLDKLVFVWFFFAQIGFVMGQQRQGKEPGLHLFAAASSVPSSILLPSCFCVISLQCRALLCFATQGEFLGGRVACHLCVF